MLRWVQLQPISLISLWKIKSINSQNPQNKSPFVLLPKILLRSCQNNKHQNAAVYAPNTLVIS